MPITTGQRSLLCLLAAAMLCCAGTAAAADSKAAAEPSKAPPLSQQRQMLSEGYSLLYIDAGHLDLLGLVLYVKSESDAVDQLITAISEYGGALKKDLEKIARDYPGVRIDQDPLPVIERRKRAAIGKDKARYFAPVIGHGGVEYERSMLISMLGALNHQSHLCRVMAEEEPDPGLKKFLLGAEQRFEKLNERVNSLLVRDYYRRAAAQ